MTNVTPFAPDFNHHDRPEIGLPFGLDPQRSPILATHWFGWQPVSAVAAEALDRYTDIDDTALDATSGRDFPPAPLHEVRS